MIGFAAETTDLLNAAKVKLARKGCDFILANNVSSDKNVFGSDKNHVYLIGSAHEEDWKQSSKTEVARKLVTFITAQLQTQENSQPLAAE